MQLTGAQILLEELVNHGVETIFGYPGGAVLPIYDELYQYQDRVKHVLTAHEQGAAHAADAYARVTGKAGVVLATSGPGATNLVTGIATAYLDSVPMVAITGNVPTSLLGKDSFQEVDTVGITLSVVKHSFLVSDINDLEQCLKQAFQIAESGRKGPVLIDIPKDVQTNLCEYKQSPRLPLLAPPSQKENDFQRIVEAINSSKRPFIYCGGGLISANASEEVIALSQKINAPIGTSLMGSGAVPSSNPLYMGLTGMHGKYRANMMKSQADLIIAVGVRFSDRATGNKKEYAENATIIHIDIDLAEFHKNITAGFVLLGDLKNELSKLEKAVAPQNNTDWTKKILQFSQKENSSEDSGVDFSPKNIIRTVHQYCNDDTVIATDVGQHQMWVLQHYPFETPRTALTSGGLGTMGFGMGAAIGASIAKNRQRTVLFTGDGSFGMNLNELATAVSEQLPIVIVIMNNGVLGMVRQWQTMFYDRRYSQTTLPRQTDFPKLAEAMGAKGYKVETIAELNQVLSESKDCPVPVLIDCWMHQDEKVLPMIPPGKGVQNMIVE
ncbi:MAG: biosynthetic-type acetolactate synthase large subunit [Brevinema sp.]